MKIKKILKISIPIILLLITITVLANSIIAATNSDWVGAQYNSGFRTTSSSGSYGILVRRLQNRASGTRYTVFCAGHGVPFDTGVWTNGDSYTPTSPIVKKACKVAYLRMVFKIWRLCRRSEAYLMTVGLIILDSTMFLHNKWCGKL